MFGGLRGYEWIFIVLLILILFGPGRIAKIFKELGESVRSFREGMNNKDEKKDENQPPEEKK